ncbi:MULTISPECIES: hypothetical protein [Enterococcus]|uniref:NfeD-like C-terminal domain-containing protein n=1 Tax=Enterococcus cecorum TaxID=44008 RepID=A0A1Y3UVF6_9ENTE|nr:MULTISPECIES: hypothetical protein [Enterococcus]KLO68527.1 hypothetical protein AA986_00315 [Enterococcus cecorum]MCJ0522393.1 hypothetical protein [Enterococcus cecorum]MCJ0537473.1 hypothetical protein [Enterococcus cecorum]MCJ0545196.1 hypothetical protein [Enterococcus cecorum]MCJ0551142.1 hypothetical protein [Enterococcus cecorum]
MQALINWLNQSIATLPDLMQALVWVGIISLGLIGLYLIFSLIFAPFMYLYNKWTDRNQSNSLSKEDYLLGELTVKIKGDSIGEVMETGSGHARATFPAKLFRPKDIKANLEIPAGSKVLIVEFDAEGRALVVNYPR